VIPLRRTVDHEPAVIAALAAGAVSAAEALRRRAPVTVVATPILAGLAAAAVTRASVTPVRRVRDPELIRPPWMLDADGGPVPGPAGKAIVASTLTAGEPADAPAKEGTP
jgi:hypothetical protein